MSEPTPNVSQEVFVATKTFATTVDGHRVFVRKDRSRVAADHELVKRYPDKFKPADQGLRFGVETRSEPEQPTPDPAATGDPDADADAEKPARGRAAKKAAASQDNGDK